MCERHKQTQTSKSAQRKTAERITEYRTTTKYHVGYVVWENFKKVRRSLTVPDVVSSPNQRSKEAEQSRDMWSKNTGSDTVVSGRSTCVEIADFVCSKGCGKMN